MAKYNYECPACGEVHELHRPAERGGDAPPCRCGTLTVLCQAHRDESTAPPPAPQVGTATASDLPAINAVVEGAMRTWQVAERVKRLATPLYRYDPVDLGCYQILVMREPGTGVVGMAAWTEDSADAYADGLRPASLHGLFVHPSWQGRGIGDALLGSIIRRARDAGHDVLSLRAQRDSEGFFARRQFAPLTGDDSCLYPRALQRRLMPDTAALARRALDTRTLAEKSVGR